MEAYDSTPGMFQSQDPWLMGDKSYYPLVSSSRIPLNGVWLTATRSPPGSGVILTSDLLIRKGEIPRHVPRSLFPRTNANHSDYVPELQSPIDH